MQLPDQGGGQFHARAQSRLPARGLLSFHDLGLAGDPLERVESIVNRAIGSSTDQG
jgi:hypothetical protein